VHGPIACEGNSWDNRHSASSGSTIYRTGFTTDINELDVIYGAEKRLFKSIREICEKYDPPAIFVYQTCITGLIGDDIEAVCKRAAEKFGKPVIPVNAPGFAGPKNLGNKLGAEALLATTSTSKRYQVAFGGATFYVLPIDEATVYNETLQLLYLEKNDLKKLDTSAKVDAIVAKALGFEQSFPTITFEEGCLQMGPVRNVYENRPV